MKNVITGIIAALILFLVVGTYRFIRDQNIKEKRFRIGLMYVPGASMFHNQVHDAFYDFVATDPDNRFVISEYPAPNFTDRISIMAVADTMMHQQCDIVVTLGALCSESTASIARRRSYDTPQVTIGCDRMVDRGMIESEEHPGGNITGANSYNKNAINEADLVTALRPQAKKVLLPYYEDCSPINSSWTRALEIQRRLKERNVKVTLLPIESTSIAYERIKMMIEGHDMLLYLSADALCACAPAFVNLANRYEVPLLAGTLDVEKHAAFSYGDKPLYKARAAFEMVKQILIDKKKPGDLPVHRVSKTYQLCINVPAALQQGYSDIDVESLLKVLAQPEFEQVHDRIEIVR
jgi:putative ABC transport system substrate-binding protein